MTWRWVIAVLGMVVVGAILNQSGVASPEGPPLDQALLSEALAARDTSKGKVSNARYLSIIDYRRPSHEPRYFLVDTKTDTIDAFLVAHGRGSDPDHDGMATKFSNTPQSKMSSLGRFVTGAPYYGRHGLSLRLHGLDPQNDKAYDRAIVIHGADYVNKTRGTLGRTWGCPALEQEVNQRLIPLIKGGSFLYVVGQGPST